MAQESSQRSFFARFKYWITLVVFTVFITFLDDNSLLLRWQYRQEIARLREEIRQQHIRLDTSTRQLHDLLTDPEEVERVARERYLMKRPDEDVFIFPDTK